MSEAADVPDERLHLRRVRFDTPPKRSLDIGPLVVRTADGSKLFRRGRLRTALEAQAERIDMAYPSAPSGEHSLRSWISRWRTATSPSARRTDALLCAIPTFLIFLPFLLFHAPSDAVRAGLVIGATLLFITYRRSQNRLRRDESLRIHARLWDRLLRSPPPPTDPEVASEDARSQTFQLRQALDGALAAAAASRRFVANLTVPAIGLLGLALISPTRPGLVQFAFPAGALLAGFLIALGRAELRSRLDQETEDLDRIENRHASRMPLLRQLGVGEGVLAELESAARRQAYRALCIELARPLDKLLPAIAAAGALFVTIEGRSLPNVDLSSLLLFIPAVYGAARLGQEIARLGAAARRVAAARALFLPSDGNDDTEPLEVNEIALRDIGFRHDHAPHPLIERISLSLKRGDVVALTGPSGCGKSTLLEILTGLCRPQSGGLWINGREQPWESLSPYRSRIACAFQDSPVSSSTIRAAIAANVPEANDSDIRHAAEDAGLLPAIASLPMGFETLLVEGALPASLLQQVLVAQALVQEPDLVVLDETLSSLDTEVAKGIVAAARRRHIMLVYATHREDLAALADRRIELPGALERIAGIAG